MGFDPLQYKTTTRQQWEDAAEAWHRWGPTVERWLADATDRMLDGAGVAPGASVLDIAAGSGGQTLAAARRVGRQGRVVATDISPTILTYAAKEAAKAGLVNVETVEADGERLGDLAREEFDAAICRLGLIYLPDQVGALRGIHAALRPGGRVSAIVYSTPDRNGFFSIPVSVIRRRAGLPAPGPGLPGPFSLGAPGALEQALGSAGFRNVGVETVEAPLLLPSAAECLRFERESFGALHQMLAAVPEQEREDVWAEVEQGLRQFEAGTGFVGPCELLIARGTH
ncbi:class I SAM-dependent methyltransferase [Geodermatophilus sp. URMC 61]|uniref:class I SAM-dependent methyltransferase n=1 Tax=Geodermatophilus sp. URMC 61 TaxID=3423411 RepID=UPI00406D4BD5